MLTVFGSLIVDHIHSVPALPTVGETVLANNLLVAPGGKGANQAAAAAKAGGQVAMVGSVGSDGQGGLLTTALQEAGVRTGAIQTVPGATGSAAVLVGPGGENAISVAASANRQTNAGQMTEAIWQETTTLLQQMEVPPQETIAVLNEARQRGVRSLLNLAPAAAFAPEALRLVDVLIVNEVELEQVAAFLGIERAAPEALLAPVIKATGRALVVTLGAEGALFGSGDQRLSAPALAIEPVDTTGAGDAFCGVFAAALDAGYDTAHALRRGAVAGSLACLKTGAQESQPTSTEIDAHL